MQSKRLTIAIPTYNRNEILMNNLPALIDQITDQCRIVIWDNSSDIPVADTLAPLLSKYSEADIVINRNRVNIGAGANIMRCLEFCETQYVWVLGDDDKIKSDAIDVILRDIEIYPTACFINYYSESPNHKPRTSTVIAADINVFLDNINNIGEALQISSSIFNCELIRKHIASGCFYQYTCAPHFVVMLKSIQDGNICILSNNSITAVGGQETSKAKQASPVLVAMRLPLLLDLPLSKDTLDKLGKIISSTEDGWLTEYGLLHQILLYAYYKNDSYNAIRYLKKIAQRFFSLNNAILMKVKMPIYLLLLHFPAISLNIIRILYKIIKGKEHPGKEGMYNIEYF